MQQPRKFPWTGTYYGIEFKVYRSNLRKLGQVYPSFSVTYYLHGERTVTRRSTWEEVVDLIDEVVRIVRSKETEVLELTGDDRRRYIGAVEALDGAASVDEAARCYRKALDYLQDWKIGVPEGAFQLATQLQRLKGTPIEAAVDFYLQHRPPVTSKKTGEVIQEIFGDLDKRLKRGDLGNYHVRDMKKYLRRFGAFHPGEIGKADAPVVEAFLDSLAKRKPGGNPEEVMPVRPRTRNNYRSAVAELLEFARLRGYLPASMLKATDGVRKVRIKKGRNHILTVEDLRHLLERCKPHLVPFIAIKSFDGIRSEESWRIEWGAIQHANSVIEVTADISKLGQRRLPPLQPNLVRWLEPFKALRGSIHPDYATAKGIIQAVTRDAVHVGITLGRNTFRNGYISYRVAQTGNAHATALEAGTSVSMIEKEYRELVTKEAGGEYFNIMPSAKRLKELKAYVANLSGSQMEHGPRRKPKTGKAKKGKSNGGVGAAQPSAEVTDQAEALPAESPVQGTDRNSSVSSTPPDKA